MWHMLLWIGVFLLLTGSFSDRTAGIALLVVSVLLLTEDCDDEDRKRIGHS